MLTLEVVMHGSEYSSISADKALNLASARVQVVDATAGSLEVQLPNATFLEKGGPTFYIINIGANSFDVTAILGFGTIVTLAAGKGCLVVLAANGSALGAWRVLPTVPLTISSVTAV